MKKIIITGGLGLIGSHLTSHFLNEKKYEEDIEVYIVDIQRSFLPHNLRNNSRDISRYSAREKLVQKAKIFFVDVRHSFEFGDIIREIKPDVLIHLAALPLANISNEISEEASSTVISSTLSIIENLKRASKNTRLVFASSSMIYGNFMSNLIDEDHPTNPISVYGSVKLAAENLVKGFCLKNNIDYCIVRPSAVYGPTDTNRRIVQAFYDDSINKKSINVNGRDSLVDFTYVEDIVQGFAKAALHPKAINQVFNITSCDPRTIGYLAQLFKEKYPNLKPIYKEHEAGVPKRGGLNCDKAKELIGFKPNFILRKGLDNYIQKENQINEYSSL